MKISELSVGDVVVFVRDIGAFDNPTIGHGSEESADVRSIDPETVLVTVQIQGKALVYQCYASDLMLLSSYLKSPAHLENIEKNKNQFNVGDIVYLSPNYGVRPSYEAPCIGSNYETDLKIVDKRVSKFGSVVSYGCYVPQVGVVSFNHINLVSPKERFKMKYKESRRYSLNHEVEGIAKKGTEFTSLNGYLYDSSTQSISLKINNDVMKSFNLLS